MNEPFDALKYAGLKDCARNKEACEVCGRVYRQTCVLWTERNGEEVKFSADVECNDCHDMRSQLGDLLKLGFEIRDRLEAETRRKPTPEVEKRISELKTMRDTQRLRYKAALDAARSALYAIRQTNGKTND